MKINFFSIFIFVLIGSFISSCHDHILNGVVQIDIQSHERGEFISGIDKENIRVRFSTDTEIKELSVQLYVEDTSKFIFEENQVVLKEEAYLNAMPHPDQEEIISFEKKELNEQEYIYETAVDLSAYPSGTCFALFGSAMGVSSIVDNGGFDSNGVFFCIE